MLQNATLLRKSAPGPPNSSDEDVSCTAPAILHASLQILFKCPTPANVFETATKPSRSAHFWEGAECLAPATQNHILTSKSAPRPPGFYTFDFEMCFAPHRVHFFNISTSKSAPGMVCFVHFNLETCFVPQRHALFHHLNFQQCSEPGVICAFWLRNVLRATTACNFSSLIWPDGSAPAALASRLFDPPEPQIIGKTQCCATLASSIFCLFLFSGLLSSILLFYSLLFSSLTLPTSAFSSVHIVGSLTSKLPSVRSRSILDRSTWGFLKWGIPKSTNLDHSILVHFTFETHGFGAWGSTILIHFRNNPHMFFFLISWILVGSLSKP